MLRPSASWRSSRKPGSSLGRLTMNDNRRDSQPWLESNANIRMERSPKTLGHRTHPTSLDCARVANGATAELPHHVFTEMVEQLMHLAGMNAARGHRHHFIEAGPILIEEHAMLEFCRIEVFTADMVVAARGRRIPLQFATHRSGVNM